MPYDTVSVCSRSGPLSDASAASTCRESGKHLALRARGEGTVTARCRCLLGAQPQACSVSWPNATESRGIRCYSQRCRVAADTGFLSQLALGFANSLATQSPRGDELSELQLRLDTALLSLFRKTQSKRAEQS